MSYLKNKTPFQCGQEDAFFNLPRLPRCVTEGRSVHLTGSDSRLVEEYDAGRRDSNDFYGSTKRLKTIKHSFNSTGDSTIKHGFIKDGQMKAKTIAQQLKELANDCKVD
jgi:hypothetical protein